MKPSSTPVPADTTAQALDAKSGDVRDDKLLPVTIRIVSSAPQWVSGGDARIEVWAPPGLHHNLEIWINGRKTSQALVSRGLRLEGVVSGFIDGDNRLEVRLAHGLIVADSIRLTNHPIKGPMFSGPHQHPFVCTTNQFGLQPKIDSDTPAGYTVLGAGGTIAGYSRDCSIDSFVTYLYRASGDTWKLLPPGDTGPADMTQITLADGTTVDFIVRREVGTINRFLYSFAMLVPRGDDPAHPNTSLWNGRLGYYFGGGVGVGHSQGSVQSGSLEPEILKRGYAIAHSSGNVTNTHYNLQLAGETAMMTKERFIERYGVPAYTVGLGASGGAVAQYILAQNHPGILDAALPVQSYPDMVSQVTSVGDCELLEHYMDVTDRNNVRWQNVKNRTLLVGMNGEPLVTDPMSAIKPLLGLGGPSMTTGSTECVNGWRRAFPLVMNPWFGRAANSDNYVPQSDIVGPIPPAIQWTHFDDARNIYRLDADGFARHTWDNIGVQYGLMSMKEGSITPAEFLDLNFKVGGWKQPRDMVQEGYPLNPLVTLPMVVADPALFDPWSRRNMTLAPAEDLPAPRTQGNLEAMRAAYTSGLVFSGHMPLPTIDSRQYLEREVNMHNAHQSFAIRQRVLKRMGTSDHLVIWFTDTMPGVVPKADKNLVVVDVMAQWMANIRAHPFLGIARNRPADAVDSCFDVEGKLIASGSTVWDGILDNKPKGACTLAFPLFSTSRIVAGAPLEGGVYKCALKSVDTALQDGTYAPWAPDPASVAKLKQIFPQGVCDYSRPDQGRP
ncbi:DUF6351 family protein [Variovorax sp. J22R115]|uniref:DUF6351 family protein n=1 Tax=Variovorax sp. J22R115 TaxID=3053509 RepID=UPI0025748FF4|nr:DUF6351 family protein [Variovorax sp. J22R115]MDM0052583.1 DUF6351 family protein [Variovorax sp. J22R115]